MTHEPDTNTDRLHVDVLLADHYPNHDRSCPDHHYHHRHHRAYRVRRNHQGHQDHQDHQRRRDYHRDHRCAHCRRHDSSPPITHEPTDDVEDTDE